MTKTLAVLVTGAVLVAGCVPASQHAREVRADDADRLTVGTVQREIRVGMSGAEVAQVLGSPNIVSTDEQRREVWIYDKLSTETVYSSSNGGVRALFLGIGSDVGGGLGGGYGAASGAVAKSQRTLTVIVKFDNAGKVRDFAYHTSRF